MMMIKEKKKHNRYKEVNSNKREQERIAVMRKKGIGRRDQMNKHRKKESKYREVEGGKPLKKVGNE